MSTLNYLLEANLALLLVLAFYIGFFSRETHFRFLRAFLLIGILSSLVFPLIHIQSTPGTVSFSIGQVIPSYWLPEVVIGDESAHSSSTDSVDYWRYTTLAYGMGLILCAAFILFQLMRLHSIIRNARTYRLDNLRIAESSEDKPTFSFFHFIFIGKADTLSATEKQQIIAHESVHARQWHSLDILLMNILKIFFWFNPFVNTYKKIFIQLHEFEADARAVENSDVNKYCSLLARVALQSADFSLASHFNQSLTVKRIEMMRTLKSNIKRWKLAVVVAVLPLIFFLVACHDQIDDDITEITRNSSHALIVPDFIQQRFAALRKEHPDKNYAVLQLNETATEKMQELQTLYGLPESMEVFKASDGEVIETSNIKSMEVFRSSDGKLVVRKIPDGVLETGGDVQTFAIIEFNAEVSRAADAAAQDKLFTVVQEQPEFPGGYDSMMTFIRSNMRYPLSARQQGIEGTVYVSFIVERDGSISDVHPIRGISPDADAEAVRVLQLSPNWTPGKQNHEVVRVRFVLPIKFRLNVDTSTEKPADAIQERPAK